MWRAVARKLHRILIRKHHILPVLSNDVAGGSLALIIVEADKEEDETELSRYLSELNADVETPVRLVSVAKWFLPQYFFHGVQSQLLVQIKLTGEKIVPLGRCWPDCSVRLYVINPILKIMTL